MQLMGMAEFIIGRAFARPVGSTYLRADCYGSQLLIHKLPTIITAATIAAAITDITITAATITDATITTTATAWPRRRRRRNPDSTAAAAAARTGVVPTSVVPSATTPAIRTNIRRTIEALCFGVGGDGGSSECEDRCKHGGYSA